MTVGDGRRRRLAERRGVAGGELLADAVPVPGELPRGPGTVGADQDLLPGQGPLRTNRTLLRARKIKAVIPEPWDQIAHRKRKRQ